MKKNLYIDHSQIKSKNFKVLLDDYLVHKSKKDKKEINLEKHLPNYFWDNEKVKLKDVYEIGIIKKEIFKFLVQKLEKIHNEKKPVRYWEIILLPWLDSLIPKIFHLWKIISNLDNKHFAHIYDYNGKNFICNNFFNLQYYENLDFNRWIISEIIIYQKKLSYKVKKKKFFLKEDKNYSKENFYIKIIKKFFKFFTFFFKIRIMIDNIQMSKLHYVLLSLNLKQFPFFWIRDKIKEQKISKKKREFLFIGGKKKNLINFIKEKMFFLFPKNYLENYVSIKSHLFNSYWPQNPEIIITSLSYWFDDYFKIWAADKVSKNTKYIIMQHGGKMGTEKIATNMDVQKKIADKYLSWGWKSEDKKVVPFFSILLSNLKNNYNYGKNSKVCFCQSTFSNYFSHLDGLPILFKDKILYTKSANQFFSHLEFKIKKNFTIRYLENQAKNRPYHNLIIDKKIKKDNSTKHFHSLIKKIRVFIHNQDSTTFLETLSANVPTILILKKDYLLCRKKEIRKYYLALEKNNIIFFDSKKAANFLNLNYDKIEYWWENKQTQKARRDFCKKHAVRNNKPILSLVNLINNIQRF